MTMSSRQPEASDARPLEGRAPDFFIVGHHKSGTTAMYEMLRRHPQIYMPDMKEPEFFGRKHAGRRASAGSPGRPQTFGESRPQTLAEYLSLFDAAAPEQRVGEASPSYLRSATAAALIAEVRPDARIIAILREPASFLQSFHLQMVRNHVQSEWDLRKAIANEGIARDGDRVHQYTDRVRYVDQLRRYHDAFSHEQVLVLIYDDFLADNDGTLRAVLRFLDVDPDVSIPRVDANATIAPRNRRLDAWELALRSGRGPISRGAKATFRALTPDRVGRQVVRALHRNVIYGSAAAPEESLTVELRSRFKGEVVALSEYLNRDLVRLWGYDDID
jgi:hypothetical protein